MSDSARAEDKSDFADEAGIHDRWIQERDLSLKSERGWRDDAEIAIQIYRSDNKWSESNKAAPTRTSKEAFNILWANVETKRPALYNSLPRPDIRRRHKDKDRLGRAISELLERCSTYVIDVQDMDSTNKAAVNDMLVPGRAVTRIKYIPTMIPGEAAGEDEEVEEVVGNQEIRFDQVQWDDFHRGPGKSWDEVTWICYDWRFTKEMVRTKWGEDTANRLDYTVIPSGLKIKDDEDLDETDDSLFKRAHIYEFWDKDQREVIWIAASDTKPLEIVEDPLNLKNFFDIPSPLYAIESSTSLVPICEYSQYRVLATELEDVTRRIGRLVNAIRSRGIYDSSMTEMEKLFESDDNTFIPAEDINRLLEAGGLDKAVFMLPIDKMAEVLRILESHRRELIQEIFQLTGISDIMRGQTNPNETKAAQTLKANFGAQRLKRQQNEVERYFRDIIRIVVEIIAENFTRETLKTMSGLNFPTNKDKTVAKQLIQRSQQHQQQAKKAQQLGLPAPPPPDPRRVKKSAEILNKPSWEEIEEVIQNDLPRDYRVDIETNSTIQVEVDEDQKRKTELLTSMGQFLQVVVPAQGAGFLDHESAKEILLASVRQGRLGRSVEDAIENMEPPKPKADPEQQKAQLEQKQSQQAHQADMQMKQIEAKAAQQSAQVEQVKAQAEAKQTQMDMVVSQKEHEFKMLELERKDVVDQRSHQRKMEELNAKPE